MRGRTITATNAIRTTFQSCFEQSVKGLRSGKIPKMDDRVIQCLIHFGLSRDISDEELEEGLEDLIAFQMDQWRFSGYELPLDELDFDGLSIQLMTILRQQQIEFEKCWRPGHHVVLLLDKILQPFPWESLDVLSNVPTSRIPQLGLLRDRLKRLSESEDGRFSIDHRQTSFLLNPSGDLKKTQTVIERLLRK